MLARPRCAGFRLIQSLMPEEIPEFLSAVCKDAFFAIGAVAILPVLAYFRLVLLPVVSTFAPCIATRDTAALGLRLLRH